MEPPAHPELGPYTVLTHGLGRAQAELFLEDLAQLGVPALHRPMSLGEAAGVDAEGLPIGPLQYEILVPESLREVCNQVLGELLVQTEGGATEAEILADLAADAEQRRQGGAGLMAEVTVPRRSARLLLVVLLLCLSGPLLIALLWLLGVL